MPYYLAIKVDKAGRVPDSGEFLLLTSSPCTTPWDDDITTMSFADPKLIVKIIVIGSYNYPIYACSSSSQIMYAISIWLDFATWNEIVILMPHLKDSPRAMNMIMPVLKKLLMQSFSSTIKPGVSFGVDQMYYAYVTRRFPLNSRSCPAWKKLCVSDIDDSSNSLIRIAKKVITGATSGDDEYGRMCEDAADSAIIRSLHDNSFEKYLAHLSQKSMKPYMEQFLTWVNANYKSMSEYNASRVFNMCVRLISGQSTGMKPVAHTQHRIVPEYIPLGRTDISNIITNLVFLRDIGLDALFIEYICGLLTCERYVFLLQIPHIMQHMSRIMQKTPIYTSLVAYAMSFAMFYVTQMECVARRDVSESAPFVFMHDMVCEFPRFADPTPYVPISVRHIDSNVPFHVSGARTPVETANIPTRLNAAMVRQTSRFDIVGDIPWTKMNLIMTGSRYASACWIGPREREIYAGNYTRYINDYIGTSTTELDAILDCVDHAGVPIQDIIGKSFNAELDGQKISDELEEKKVSSSTSPRPMDDLIKSLDSFAFSAASGVLNTAVLQSELKSSPAEEIDELPYLENENARALFMKLKYSSELFGNHSDIDIGFVGDAEKFDATATSLVMHLRRYGKAVALRFQKARSYTWVIVTSFLNYTIDLFHVYQGSPLGLIINFMTSYPRAWFNGVSHMCTADYVCARMSGINNRYIFTMNDPVYTMMKAARREDITILLNYGEQRLLKLWLEENMPGVKLVLGNVDMSNEFFGRANTAHNNERKPWISDTPVMPKSRIVLTPWTTENAEPLVKPLGHLELVSGKKIRTADPTVFGRYMAEIIELANENVVRDLHLTVSS